MDKYRVENNKIYEYDERERAYFFVGFKNGRTLAQFVHDRNRQLMEEEMKMDDVFFGGV